MHATTLVTPLLLALFPAAQGPWKPLYDYTRLPPSNEEFWAPLGAAQVQMEDALELAAQTEGAEVRPLKASLKPGEAGATWDLELFVGDGKDGKPQRVNLSVSVAEPKVVRRLELLEPTKEEVLAWNVMTKTQVPAAVAIQLCKGRTKGGKPEPAVDDPRMRLLEFVAVETAPIWNCELMGIEKEIVRRVEFLINAEKPVVRRRLLLDRFAGEPLRSAQPIALENGMYVHDFIVGDGAVVAADSKVQVNYRLFLLDNTKLHDTWKSKRPETFLVSQAPLKGMTEGLIGMRVGGKRKLAMPYALAFGEAGNEIAPPKAMVVCDVFVEQLLDE
jgi:peptidylprolyl isomerase